MWEAVQLEIRRRKAFAKKYKISKLDYATVNNPWIGYNKPDSIFKVMQNKINKLCGYDTDGESTKYYS